MKITKLFIASFVWVILLQWGWAQSMWAQSVKTGVVSSKTPVSNKTTTTPQLPGVKSTPAISEPAGKTTTTASNLSPTPLLNTNLLQDVVVQKIALDLSQSADAAVQVTSAQLSESAKTGLLSLDAGQKKELYADALKSLAMTSEAQPVAVKANSVVPSDSTKINVVLSPASVETALAPVLSPVIAQSLASKVVSPINVVAAREDISPVGTLQIEPNVLIDAVVESLPVKQFASTDQIPLDGVQLGTIFTAETKSLPIILNSEQVTAVLEPVLNQVIPTQISVPLTTQQIQASTTSIPIDGSQFIQSLPAGVLTPEQVQSFQNGSEIAVGKLTPIQTDQLVTLQNQAEPAVIPVFKFSPQQIEVLTPSSGKVVPLPDLLAASPQQIQGSTQPGTASFTLTPDQVTAFQTTANPILQLDAQQLQSIFQTPLSQSETQQVQKFIQSQPLTIQLTPQQVQQVQRDNSLGIGTPKLFLEAQQFQAVTRVIDAIPNLFVATCNNNGIREGTESCDGQDLGGATCESSTGIAGQTGILTCKSDCTFDTGNCQAPKQVLVAPTPECRTDADCNDNNSCTTDQCLQICTQTPTIAPSVGPDGVPVVGVAGETNCQLQCVRLPVDINDQNSCTTDNCDTTTGAISHDAIPNCPPATCGDGTVNQPTEECDFAAEGETPDTCDQNCKKVVPVIVASCHCDDPEDRVTKGACTEGGVECCIPIKKDGKRSTFTCDFNVRGGTPVAALSLQQKLLSNSTVLWTQTSGKNTIKSVTSSQGADVKREGAVVVQSISIPAGTVEAPTTSIKAFAAIPEGNGSNFENYQMTVMVANEALVASSANAPINFAIEASGGGGTGGCSLIR